MKKTALLFGCLLLATLVFAQSDDKPYDFPVKPGSEKWQSFKTVEDMYAVCQIPADVLDKLSTTALIQTCLDYPASAVMFIHNTPQQGFDEWARNFNGIAALLARPDAREKLLAYYKSLDVKGYQQLKTDVSKGEYTFLLQRIEAIMAQDAIIGRMDATEKKQLLRITLAKYDAISTDPLYGFISLKSTGRIALKLASTLGDKSQRPTIQSEQIQAFAATGAVDDQDLFLAAIKEAKTISVR